MLAFVKKIHRHSDELLHLALILSLIRVDPESYLGLGLNRGNSIRDSFHNITMGDSWAHMPSDFHRGGLAIDVPYLHPKSVEASLAQYQEELIEDLNDLGRYTSIVPPNNRPRTVGYLLDDGNSNSLNRILSTSSSTVGVSPVVASNGSGTSSMLNTVEPPPSQVLLDSSRLESSGSDLTEEVNKTEWYYLGLALL